MVFIPIIEKSIENFLMRNDPIMGFPCRRKNGMDVVGKGSWKDREVGKFHVGKNFRTTR